MRCAHVCAMAMCTVGFRCHARGCDWNAVFYSVLAIESAHAEQAMASIMPVLAMIVSALAMKGSAHAKQAMASIMPVLAKMASAHAEQVMAQ